MPAKTKGSVVREPKVTPKRLKDCEFFADFSLSERGQILGFSKIHRLIAGAQLFAEGEPCLALNLVLEGELKMSKVSAEGKEQVVRHVRRGQIFGAAPLFTPKGVFPATALALTESMVLSVPKEKLMLLFKKNPALCLKALSFVSQHLQDMMTLVEKVSLDKVPRRLATYLLDCAKAQGGPKAGQLLRLELTQTALAAELGTVREVIGRTLHQFEMKGWIELKPKGLLLKNPDSLSEA